MYKIIHHNIVKMIFVREPSTILKYKVIQAQRVWNESDIFLSPGKQERQVIYHFIQEFDPGSG